MLNIQKPELIFIAQLSHRNSLTVTE